MRKKAEPMARSAETKRIFNAKTVSLYRKTTRIHNQSIQQTK